MKRFSLEEYLKNPTRKIVTRDGHNARIICTDRRGLNVKPIAALITIPNGDEIIKTYWENGVETQGYEDNPNDLFFVPIKKEGWIKVYYGNSRCNTFVCNRIFATKEEAEKQKNDDVVAIIKIEWEE